MGHKFNTLRNIALSLALAGAGVTSAQAAPEGKIKVGFMLPYTGTYASLGMASALEAVMMKLSRLLAAALVLSFSAAAITGPSYADGRKRPARVTAPPPPPLPVPAPPPPG